MSLLAGQTVIQNVQCDAGAIATDGSTRVASVDQGTGDPSSLKVIESRAVARDTYRFTVRNDATGRAQVQLFVVCLSPTTSVNDHHVHELVTLAPVTSSQTLAGPGRQTITLAVPLDHRAIAPGFVVSAGAARLVASEPTPEGWALTFDVPATADVMAEVRPLRRRVAEVANHSHQLGFRHIAKTVTVPARSTLQDVAGVRRRREGHRQELRCAGEHHDRRRAAAEDPRVPPVQRWRDGRRRRS